MVVSEEALSTRGSTNSNDTGLGASDCKTEPSRRHMLADVSTNQTV
jgi:hypothetical protein